MNRIPPRLVIYARDIENVTGRKRRTAQVIMQKIRAFFNKSEKDFATVSEFCRFMNIEEELVRDFLVD